MTIDDFTKIMHTDNAANMNLNKRYNKSGFFEKVYDAVKLIPKGNVATYGTIARIIGEPRKARYVGWALHSNPYPRIVPCHRVVDRNGNLSGAFAFGGPHIQRQMLEDEGVEFMEDGTIDLEKFQMQREIKSGLITENRN